MTGDKAAELSDIIRALGVKNTVCSQEPFTKGYFVRVVGRNHNGTEKVFDFRSFKAWDKFWKKVQDERRALREFIEKNRDWLPVKKPRTPLDIMIDKACGVEP